MATDGGSGLPLESYTKSVPPGWRVGAPKYTFRRFLERLRLWYRQTDVSPESLGPAVAGRLQGRLFDTALGLKFTLVNGNQLVGDEALAFPGTDAVLDPNTGTVLTPAQDNGLRRLLRVLTAQYGADDQQQITGIIDQYDDLRQGRMSLLDYLSEEATLFDDATRLANYGLNDVARTHKLLKHSNLSDDRKGDLLLKLNYDYTRHDDLRRLLEKMAKTKQPNQLPVPLGGSSGTHYTDDGWYYADGDSTWYANDLEYVCYQNDMCEGYYNNQDPNDAEHLDYDDAYDEDYYYDDSYDQYYGEVPDASATASQAGMPAAAAAPSLPAGGNDLSWAATDWSDQSDGWDWASSYGDSSYFGTGGYDLATLPTYWGKGKGKGKRRKGKGKGKGKSFGKFGKGGFGKGGYGKSKSFGKHGGSSKKGYGGKGFKGGTYKGFGEGKKGGCDKCGSPNHASDGCPWGSKGWPR